MIEPRDLSTADVQALSGATYRQIDYWCRTFELCGADRARDEGTGHPRYFTRSEARAARAIRMLGEAGINVGMYARAVVAAVVALPTATHLVLERENVTTYTDEVPLVLELLGTAHPVTLIRLETP